MITIEQIYLELEVVNGLLPPVDWRHAALGVHHEMGELLSAVPWRPWRLADQRPPTPAELDRATEELADVIATTVRVGTYLGLGAARLDAAVTAHLARKFERIRDGIDGGKER